MSDQIRIGTLELLGISTSIEVEEGRSFRRIAIQKRRLVFGDYKKVGEIHIYVDEVERFIGMLREASQVMKRIGEVGWEQASLERGKR